MSSLPKCFRTRRDRPYKKKHAVIEEGAIIDLPSSSTESDKEVAISNAEEQKYGMPPGGATAVQEVVLERQEETKLDENGTHRPAVVETSEEIDCCGCPVSLRAVKEVVDEIPTEYKEAARTSSLVFASLAGLFFSIVFYRYLRHLYTPEPEGFFCSTFSWLFSPLFDALCHHQQPGGFFHEISHESSVLATELRDAFSHFFQSVFNGFHALGVIFSKMIEGLVGNFEAAINELLENVHENIAFLLRFCGQLVHAITHITIDIVRGCGQSVSDAFTNNL